MAEAEAVRHLPMKCYHNKRTLSLLISKHGTLHSPCKPPTIAYRHIQASHSVYSSDWSDPCHHATCEWICEHCATLVCDQR